MYAIHSTVHNYLYNCITKSTLRSIRYTLVKTIN